MKSHPDLHFVFHCNRQIQRGFLPMKLNTVGNVAPGVAAIFVWEMLNLSSPALTLMPPKPRSRDGTWAFKHPVSPLNGDSHNAPDPKALATGAEHCHASLFFSQMLLGLRWHIQGLAMKYYITGLYTNGRKNTFRCHMEHPGFATPIIRDSPYLCQSSGIEQCLSFNRHICGCCEAWSVTVERCRVSLDLMNNSRLPKIHYFVMSIANRVKVGAFESMVLVNRMQSKTGPGQSGNMLRV